MFDLAELLRNAMRRRSSSTEAVADITGIRRPRVSAFVDGASKPIRPTHQELTKLAQALALPPADVLGAGRLESQTPGGGGAVPSTGAKR